MLMYKF